MCSIEENRNIQTAWVAKSSTLALSTLVAAARSLSDLFDDLLVHLPSYRHHVAYNDPFQEKIARALNLLIENPASALALA